MTAVVLTFQAHQPHRLARLRFRDVGRGRPPFDEALERSAVERVAARCYVPMNALLLELVDATRHRFRCALGITGTLLAQLERWAPEVVAGFVRLARTGAVEFVCGTAWHSLSALEDAAEFRAQVAEHRRVLRDLAGVAPRTFDDGGLALDAPAVEELGFECVLRADSDLGGRSPHRVHRAAGCRRLTVLARDRRLSDELASGCGDVHAGGDPATAARFAAQLARVRPADVVCVTLALETFGARDAASNGTLGLLRHLPRAVLGQDGLAFATPMEAARAHAAADVLDVPRDPAKWLGNELQRAAHEELYALLPRVRAEKRRPELLADWRRLSDADHLRALRAPDHLESGAPPDAAPPSPHDSFITFMHALDDLHARIGRAPRKSRARRTRTNSTSSRRGRKQSGRSARTGR